MRSAVWFFIGIIFGAAGGAYVAKSIAEKKAEDQIANATIEARDYYKEKYKPKEDDKKTPVENATRIYGRAFDIYDYNVIEQEPVKVEDPDKYTFEIVEDEYGTDPEYTIDSLDLYSDGNLVDEMGNVIEHPVSIIGSEVLDGLGSRAVKVAYVRNDLTKTDYEVCYVDAPYEETGGVKD